MRETKLIKKKSVRILSNANENKLNNTVSYKKCILAIVLQ